MSLAILNDISASKATPYNICKSVSFKMRKVHSVYNATEILCQLRAKIWSLVPHEIRQFLSLSNFKSKTKKWTLFNWLCRLCKKYLWNKTVCITQWFSDFKSKTKKWSPSNCPKTLRKKHLHQVGYIWINLQAHI